jgi:phytoene/squalene synthetase
MPYHDHLFAVGRETCVFWRELMLDTNGTAVQSEKLEQGYKVCRRRAKKELKTWTWLVSNVGGDNKKGLNVMLAQFLETAELLDLDSPGGSSLGVWKEIQEDLANAFAGEAATPELTALVDTCERYDVDKQFVFEPIQAVDDWIVKREFKTFEQLEAFCDSFGGSMMAALAPVIGVVKQDFQEPAIACGKVVMLTQLLANCVGDMKHNRNFLAKDDLEDCAVDIARIKLRKPTQEFRHLVRLYTSRLDKMFIKAGELVGCMDFDGRRSLTSLLAVCWKLVSKMKVDPDSVLSADGVLTSGEKFALRSKHLLGMDYKLPFVPDDHGHH